MGTHSNRVGATRARTGDGNQPNVGQLPLVRTLEGPPTTAYGSPAPRSRAAGHRASGGSRRRPAGGRRRRGGGDTGGRRRTAVALGVLAALTAAGVTWNSFSPSQATPGGSGGVAAAQPDALDVPLPTGVPSSAPGSAPGSASATPGKAAPGSAAPSAPASAAPTTAAPTPSASPATSAPAVAPPPAPASTSAHPSPSPTATPSGDFAQQVIDLVNIQRAQNGCGPVTANAKLQQAAQGQSDDMAARNFFDHTNPDGAGPQQRIDATGYKWSTWGENIAMGQPTPAAVMDSWMNSPGHRANILNCAFKELGVGVHMGPGGPWWTQDFGAPA